jgi:hypothetical protein
MKQMTTLQLNTAEVYYILNALSMSKKEFSELRERKEIEDTTTLDTVLNNTDRLISKIENASGVEYETV